MKKRNVFICFIFSLLVCLTLSFSTETKRAFAEGESTDITITFDSGSGECDTETMTLQVGGSIAELPIPTYEGFHFVGWSNGTEYITKSTTFSENTTLTATYVKKYFKYYISGTGSALNVTAETTSSDIDYPLSDACDLENAIYLISEDIKPVSSQATISFDDITLEKNLEINIQNVILTGTINLGEFSINYTAPASGSSSLGLENLTLNATSNQNIINLLGENRSNLNISNTVFNATSANKNYAINLENPIHQLTFSNSLSYSTEYLYNFEKTTTNAKFNNTLTLTSPSKIAITIPYYCDQQPILKTYLTSESFEFIANQSNFTCSVITNTSTSEKDICATTSFDLSFDENGGTIENAFTTTSTTFSNTTKLDFPTETNYKKPHYTLDGFVGKITIDTADYYFDLNALNAYLADSTPSVQEHFYTSIPTPDSNAVGFTYYIYSRNASDKNFLATDLMLRLNKVPTFVAVWKHISYSVSFEENGGSLVEDKFGIFGSAITLPTSSDISKSGYDFIGWFTSATLAESADEANKINPSQWQTMPDSNPTLYAGWKLRNHTLTIVKNNQTVSIEKTVGFGTLLNTINEITQTVEKTGYTFAGWFTDNLLINELSAEQTMPDSDFSIYAAWTINEYTITLYLNHPSDDSIYKTATREYNSNISDLFTENPSFVGDNFGGWFTDIAGRYPLTTLPEMMPAEDLTLYAGWNPVEYRLTIYYPALNDSETIPGMHFGDTLPLYSLEKAGYNFDGWYADEDCTVVLTTTTMPSNDFAIYAKFVEKLTINLDIDVQSYVKSDIESFDVKSPIDGFVVEYLVNGVWTTTVPQEKGSYDIRISRNEDNVYKAYVKTFESAFVITAEELNVTIISLILYCVATFELLCSIIVLFIRKQRKTYLAYSIALPFGIIPTSQFVNLIISLTLTVFGFVLLTIQLVKLKKVNNQIAKISSENKEYTPPDVSENENISKKVEIMLQQQGFVSVDESDQNQIEEDEEFELSDEDRFSSLEEQNDEEYLSFGSEDDKKDFEE